VCRTERRAADSRYLVAELVISTAILKVLYIRLSYDRSIASSQAKYSQLQSSVSSFIFQYQFVSLSHPVSAYVFLSSSRRFYLSLHLSFNNAFCKSVSTQDMSIQLTLLLFNLWIIFPSSLILCNNSSFFTR